MSHLTLSRIVLLLGIIIVLTNAQKRRPGWMRRKPECPPASRINAELSSSGIRNILKGSCSVLGNRRDSCRRRMSCCENSQGEFLCIRARRYKTHFRKPQKQPLSSPQIPPRQAGIMQNEQEITNPLCPNALPKVTFGNEAAQPCVGYHGSVKECTSDFDCTGMKICCYDPCPSDKQPLKLCLDPMDSAFNNLPEPSFPSDNFPMENFPSDTTFPGDNVAANNFHTNNSFPTDNTFPKDNQADKSGNNSDILQPPPPPTAANAMLNDVEIPNENCPKPDVQCDPEGKHCAVSCPGYAFLKECNSNLDCEKGRICCEDPCPNAKQKFCFPDGSQSTGKTKSADLKVEPPRSAIIQDEEAKVSSPQKCPAGDFTSCIGWVEDPNKKGSGACKSNKDCAPDLECCKITECFDGTKHCVKPIDNLNIPKGCPTPSYFAAKNFKACSAKKKCPEKQICCPLDKDGTMGCV